MRVGHISVGALPPVFSDAGGAVQRRVGELALAQAAAGHEVTVFSPAREASTERHEGVTVRFLPCRTTGSWMHLEFLGRCRAAMGLRSRLDVLHVHNEPEAGWLFNGAGLPMVLSFDNYFFRQRWGERLRPAYRRALLRYDRLLPVSAYCEAEALGHWGLPRSRSFVLPNGVNLSQFAPSPSEAVAFRERHAIEGDVLVYLGRVCRQKGTHVLLEAYAQVRRAARRPVRLVLAGPIGEFDDASRPAESAYWQEEVNRAGATYVGRLPERDLRGLLSMAGVFVMPTVELEMQGMAALEAQACGTPVVASDHGGLREMVPESCGIRVPVGDHAALATAALSLLDRQQEGGNLAATARAHASEYAWDEIAARAVRAYEAAAGRGEGDRLVAAQF